MKNLKIFTKNIEEKALEQINLLLEQDAFKDCKVRVMPDVHAGAGCVIGFTANLGDKVIPNVVGVDIGCGMTWIKTNMEESDLNLKELDEIIHTYIPSGMNAREDELESEVNIEDLYCFKELKNKDRYLQRSLGSLGGGNHFIEVDKDEQGLLIFIVHSGSRNLGKQVCEIYQNKAIDHCSYKEELNKNKQLIIKNYKQLGLQGKIQQAIKDIEKEYSGKTKLPKSLCYIEGEEKEHYLHDMKLCQKWASQNRSHIIHQILGRLDPLETFHYHTDIHETIHNYIGDDNIVRKGAISAKENEIVLIPINMKDGCIIGRGKGSSDWNYSAPHGAGRIMSRHEARNKLQLADYENSMKDIFTTSVCEETIDEAPMVYKPMKEIVNNIKGTIEILEIVRPIYNFKAKE